MTVIDFQEYLDKRAVAGYVPFSKMRNFVSDDEIRCVIPFENTFLNKIAWEYAYRCAYEMDMGNVPPAHIKYIEHIGYRYSDINKAYPKLVNTMLAIEALARSRMKKISSDNKGFDFEKLFREATILHNKTMRCYDVLERL